MDTLTKTQTGHLIERLIEHCKLDRDDISRVEACRDIISKAILTRVGAGDKVMEIAKSKTKINNIAGYLNAVMGSLPMIDPLSIEEEIKMEKADIQEHMTVTDAINGMIHDGSLVPYFREREELSTAPFLFDKYAYEGYEEIYLDNPFIEIFREAVRRKTSMHEVCRERGLTYELLLR